MSHDLAKPFLDGYVTYGWNPLTVSYHQAIFGAYWPSGSEDITCTYFFYKQLVYKQLAFGWHFAKQFSGLSPLSRSNNKNYKLKKSGVCNKRKIAAKPTIHQNSAVSIVLLGKFHKSDINIDFESWKVFYSSQKNVTWSDY